MQLSPNETLLIIKFGLAAVAVIVSFSYTFHLFILVALLLLYSYAIRRNAPQAHQRSSTDRFEPNANHMSNIQMSHTRQFVNHDR